MKKVLIFLTLTVVLLMCFISCDGQDEHTHSFGEWSATKNATCTDDGVKTRYCDCGEKQTEVIPATGEDENGNIADIVTVEDGYLVVNGVKTEYKVYSDPVITIIDGYVAVNGVKTEYMVANECNHIWQTVTTNATCTEDGYDTMTCALCDKSVKVNETPQLDHSYSTNYSYDGYYHWFKCAYCDATKDQEPHTVGENNECTTCGIPTSATVGVIYDISADGTYAEVVGYYGSATKIKIADTYESLPVKSIYSKAFFENDTITSVIIPDSVTSIGQAAFYYCSGLTSVVIGNSVTSIGQAAFYYCSSLTSVVIPDSVETIGKDAFEGCSSLASVVIPDSVTTIGEHAFHGCSSLVTVTIPSSVTSIGVSAFIYCDNLTSVVIGDSVTNIGGHAFAYCPSLTSIVIPDSVTSIGGRAFYGCPKLQFNEYENGKYFGSKDNPYFALVELITKNMSSYTIHSDTKIILDGVFQQCARLTSIIIPDNIITIGDYAFNQCTSLASIVIPDSVTTIGKDAFSDCPSLTSVVIPDSVTTIGDEAFNYCLSLKDVYYTGSEEEWKAIRIGTYNSYLTSATIHYNYVPEN